MKVLIKTIFLLPLVLVASIQAETSSFDCPCPHNMAHRGASGLFPQATTVAFDEALSRGADVLEMDVQITADNQLVVHHDETTEATAGLKKKVSEMTLSEVKQLDAGQEFTLDGGSSYPWRNAGLRFLTLEDVVKRYPGQRLNVEMKPDNKLVAQLMASEIARLQIEDRIVVASSNSTPMKEFRQLTSGQIPTSAYTGEVARAMFAWFFGAGETIKPEYRAIQMPMSIASRPFVEFLQNKGVKVHIWTVNERKDIERMLDIGADGIIGDYPLLTEQILVEKGLR
ncbi:glycerophosphodiester phosphodiesterase [Parendozoicomonas sp. Alg238-R29]|uniref:glycerophosphodiester phosphodiesterase n=1 Tax=Parendozoicomonas sp. Alg238-R29 TaxID=2993446 RepID=UPI00248DC485|nr:glycerophosphodiester phosphodiesterase [Parendozoicomonas sp. Alg238-R29]